MEVTAFDKKNFVFEIITQSHVPMFVAWGPAGTLFYNEACQPLIGLPPAEALELPVQTVFAGNWEILGPAFDKVMQGKSVTIPEIQLFIDRNGHREPVSYTFSCIPIPDARFSPCGMLVTATENPSVQHAAQKKIYDILLQLPIGILTLRMPDYRIELANNSFLQITTKEIGEITGRSLFEVNPGLKGQLAEELIDQVVQTGKSHIENGMPLRIERNGGQVTAYFNILFYPLLESDGICSGVMLVGREVTDIVLEKKRMEKSEHYFRRLADTVPVMLWITRPDGSCTYVNQKWYDYTGQPPENTLGQRWLSVVHPDDLALMTGCFEEANTHQVPFNFEYRIKGADGNYRWILDSGSPMFDNSGVFEGFIGSVVDIDNRKLAEDAVREREKRFRQLADSMPQIVWTANADGYVDYYNKQWTLLIGEENQFGDSSFLKHVHPDDQERCLESWQEVVRSGETLDVEFRFKVKYPAETYRWFLVRARPIKNDGGQIIKWYGTCTDIDEVKTIRLNLELRVAERTHEISHKNKALEETTRELKEINQQLELRHEELRQSEERYLRMTNEVEDYSIILLSKEGYIENWNKGAEKIKGYTADEIIGMHFRLFYTYTDQQHNLPEKLIAEACLHGKSTFEGLRVRKDGSTFWAYTVLTALHNDKNDIIGFSKVTRDLTKQKQAEDQLKMYAEQLEQKNRELERSNGELSSFSYVASHDLQEPLRKIQAFGNLIQARDVANLSDTSKDYFERMVKAAIRMQNLIDSLLEFSRTTTARKNFESTDLNVLLEDVKRELAHRIEEKKAEIITAHLPTLTIIPFQFRQLLSNLISNSLKYSRDETTPVIEITASYIKAKDLDEKAAIPGKDYFRFKVKDNGIGFEQEFAEKIFDLFQRLHGRNEYSGSGIGLAICKKIVENHHGFMRAESEAGEGATFYFFIPVK
ncbi:MULTISPECIES: PAS domain S-box protein [Niastella]|uniref:histidine kinase n=1 Tax=Niastella soli TaxID=2821487 RepID=A0ABS3Z559_9BACT|nr:PAS domain S-box protein [Niastella soli]MBO9205297.1 PAS domain S-box protein [Niastella soli]